MAKMPKSEMAPGGRNHMINGASHPIMKLGKSTKSNKFASGGHVDGDESSARLDKRARGGRTGGAPFSTAHSGAARPGKSSSGHEGE